MAFRDLLNERSLCRAWRAKIFQTIEAWVRRPAMPAAGAVYKMVEQQFFETLVPTSF